MNTQGFWNYDYVLTVADISEELAASIWLVLTDPEDGGSMSFWNVVKSPTQQPVITVHNQ
jgi:hypothetical protein